MRIFSISLSLYILCLSVLYCGDGLTQCISNDTVVNVLNHTDHSHPVEQEDNCTPFCTCSCCGTFLIIPLIEKPAKTTKEHIFSYKMYYAFDYSFDYSLGVWHPPSIV
ncbi:DUF6660 family protein [Portibacter marinus]|uniref:DUF6660 family protein n=1 Tax=Portibacter marinus TaxID=2898660 RepID=UPI003872E002